MLLKEINFFFFGHCIISHVIDVENNIRSFDREREVVT